MMLSKFCCIVMSLIISFEMFCVGMFILIIFQTTFLGEELECDNPQSRNDLLCAQRSILETQLPEPEANDHRHSEDLRLIARARAVGVQYEFAQPGVVETEDDRAKRQRPNQRKYTNEEKRLRGVVGDLPPPPPVASSELEDSAYLAIRAFEVDQMTYKFSCCEVCQERRLEGKGTGNMCTRCRRDKKVPKVSSDEQCVFLRNCLTCQMQSRC